MVTSSLRLKKELLGHTDLTSNLPITLGLLVVYWILCFIVNFYINVYYVSAPEVGLYTIILTALYDCR